MQQYAVDAVFPVQYGSDLIRKPQHLLTAEDGALRLTDILQAAFCIFDVELYIHQRQTAWIALKPGLTD